MKVKLISEERVTKYALDAKKINELTGTHKMERLEFMEEMVKGATFAATGPYRIKVDVQAGHLTVSALLQEFENYLVRVLTRKHGVKKAQAKAAKVIIRLKTSTDRKPIVEFTPEPNPLYKTVEVT